MTPYLRPLAAQVVSYLEAERFEVGDWRALEVADNAEVACIPGDEVMAAARDLNLSATRERRGSASVSERRIAGW